MKTMKSLIIIPAFNEVENVPVLVKNVAALGYDYIVINDCSTDNSAEVYRDLGLPHLDLPLNMGLANVTQIGFKYAYEHDYNSAIVLDGDGQHLPKYIKPLLEKVEEGYDYVVGSRFLTEKKPWSLRMIGSRLLCVLIKIKTGKTITDPTSGMRAMGKSVLKDFSESMNYIAEPDALVHVLHSKHKMTEVQVEMEERTEGKSYFTNPLKSINFMFNVMMSIIFVQ